MTQQKTITGGNADMTKSKLTRIAHAETTEVMNSLRQRFTAEPWKQSFISSLVEWVHDNQEVRDAMFDGWTEQQ